MCDTCGCTASDGHGETMVLPVKGMECSACAKKLEEVVGKLPGLHHVKADADQGTLSFAVSENGDLAAVRNAVLGAGFEV